jgi:dihydrofolate reductase
MTQLQLIAVVARAHNGVIGLNNKMPWHLPEDLQHFRRLTTGHPVIMGRKTLESIGRELPERKMIVLSRSNKALPAYAHRAHNLADAIAQCPGSGTAFVIGGAEIYRLTLPHCSAMVVTEIELDVVGDAWFPEPDAHLWIRTDRQEYVSKTGLQYCVNHYRRRAEHEGPALA